MRFIHRQNSEFDSLEQNLVPGIFLCIKGRLTRKADNFAAIYEPNV
jgi:hypothetical protein